jgi:hypothetical protein
MRPLDSFLDSLAFRIRRTAQLSLFDYENPSTTRDGYVELSLYDSDFDATAVIGALSLGIHLLKAAEERRAPPGSISRRTRSGPLSRARVGDVNFMAAFLGVGPELREHLLMRRERAMDLQWALDENYKNRSEGLMEIWHRRLVA